MARKHHKARPSDTRKARQRLPFIACAMCGRHWPGGRCQDCGIRTRLKREEPSGEV